MLPEARIIECGEAAYHNDDLGDDYPRLSSSIAGTLISQSPAHAYVEHPKLGGKPRAPSTKFDLGTAVHTLLLGEGQDIVTIDANDYRTKAASEARKAAWAAGKTPLLTKQLDAVEAAAEKVWKRLNDRGITLDGPRECTILWTERATNGGVVHCKARLDHLDFANGIIDDLKTGHSANPDDLAKKTDRLNYAIQVAAYTSAVGTLRPDLAGRVRFRWLLVELSEPFAFTVAEPDGSVLQLGGTRWRRAVDAWEECTRTGTWPEYVRAGETATISAPPWAMRDEIENAMSGDDPDWLSEGDAAQ